MSVREIRPGVWYVQVYDHRRPDGTRPRLPRQTVYGTERAARKAERKMLVERDENTANATTDRRAVREEVPRQQEAGEAGPTHLRPL